MSLRKRLAFGLIVAFFLLAAAETVLRLHDFGFYYNFGADLLGMPLLELHRIRRVQNRTVEFDPVLFWRFKPNQRLTDSTIYRRPVTINSHGFRGTDFAIPKPAGTYRVVCLGDSSTFGWSVADDETYPFQLARELQTECFKLEPEVINLGVTGYTSHQGRRLFERIGPKLQPDVVIFAFGPNDRLPALKSDREHEAARTWDIGPVSLFLSRFQLYKLVKAGVVYLQNRSAGLDLDPKTYIPRLKRKVSPAEYADNLRAVKAICDRLGADLIVLDVQYPSLPPDYIDNEIKKQAAAAGAAMPAGWQPWDESTVTHAAAAVGVPVINLRELFEQILRDCPSGNTQPPPGKSTFSCPDPDPWRLLMVDNGHPNPLGHRTIAFYILRQLKDSPGFGAKCGIRPPPSHSPPPPGAAP